MMFLKSRDDAACALALTRKRHREGAHYALDRRTFLVAGTLGLFGANVARADTAGRRPARSAIMIWLSGGASHIDMWDMKPDAPAEYRGIFQPVSTSAPGIQLCEYLPHLGRQAHHLAIVRSLGDHGRGTGDHHAGYYYNLTGHAPDRTFHQLLNARTPYPNDWPSIASVVESKRPPHPFLPSLITLPHKEGAPLFTRPGQFAARLGIEHDPVFIEGTRARPLDFSAPALSLRGDVAPERLLARRELLNALDEARRQADHALATHDYSTQQRRAFTLLASRRTQAAFDLRQEPETVRAKYGPGINATSMLLARRLVEAAVPFVSVFWKGDERLNTLCKSGGGWDTHGNNFNCLRDHLLPEFDRPFAALLDDLHQRGLLAETLVIVTSEMGRKPRIGDPRSGGAGGAGRDHWPACMSVLLAGGGVRGGQVYGTTDRRAEYPNVNPVAPEHIARTIFHALGIEDLTATDREGRPFHLLDEGRPLTELF
jgi:uncharacterized protein (DUF1501 family)